jgi:hypothetical protein
LCFKIRHPNINNSDGIISRVPSALAAFHSNALPIWKASSPKQQQGATMNADILTQPPEPGSKSALDQLENRVQSKLSGRIRNLRLLRHGDGVVLRGFARTFYAKQLAQHAVMTESELPILANEIEVF